MSQRNDETTRNFLNASKSKSSIRAKKAVRRSLSLVHSSDRPTAAVAIDAAINAGCDAVRDARMLRVEKENKALKRELAESRASEQVFRAAVTRLRERLSKVER